MASNSTLSLLFEIAADPSKAVNAVQASSAEITASLSGIQASSASAADEQAGFSAASVASSEAAARGAGKVLSAHTEAMHGIRGMGEELGIHMPRFVSSYLSSLGPVAGVMTSAFSAIAIVGVIEVLGQLSAKMVGWIDDLNGWDKESAKYWEDTKKAIIDSENQLLSYRDKLREISEIGLTGMELQRAKERDLAAAIADRTEKLNQHLAGLHNEQTVLEANSGLRNKLLSAENKTWGDMTAAADDATASIKDHETEITKLRQELVNLNAEQLKLAAEGPVEQQKADDEALKKSEEAAKKLVQLT